MSKRKETDNTQHALANELKKNEGVTSISMSFESSLIESSREKNTYSVSWVESEIKKSSRYFNKEIYSDD
ncbi:hypothetical protein [Pseudomonas syringae]|uniref:hypothetical protein n=1 Tax=Pseudomonas syringae TaxID=317 RepID=UPI001F0E5117|nr:hypothetical protein [Pseudomonas syringae]MCH5508865.1 hypothetical protein [Pseudomonas syringae pv. syringae]MCH5518969.1 hypothetical protein [Pseudomonas syringae pv. lapsa]MCH5637632.1 hypothetical protein [Pseudomonas syringae pv. syringae]MCH7426765.1 hypothetical protein [Pseudomonas syringae pv. syringae]